MMTVTLVSLELIYIFFIRNSRVRFEAFALVF